MLPKIPVPALALACLVAVCRLAGAEPFDAAPFALPLPGENGLLWEDPREIHRVVVHLRTPPDPGHLPQLEYWGSWWPERHLPKDREPGGGDIGWMELGNWWKYGWRKADADAQVEGKRVTFAFRPINAREFPKQNDYSATFRYTLKVRLAADAALPAVERFEAFTDSVWEERAVRLAGRQSSPSPSTFEVFNGRLVGTERGAGRSTRLRLQVATNPDPNTFDRTLVTVRGGKTVFTFRVDDLAQGPLFLPQYGVAVLPDNDPRDYAAVARETEGRGGKTLYDRVAELPEQTWQSAWSGMPPKKSDIYFPLGLDGGRQRFRLSANGGVSFRSNDGYLLGLPGRDTPRLGLEKPEVSVSFELPNRPSFRTLAEESLPVCTTEWEQDGVRVQQVAFVTPLEGTRSADPAPPGDAMTVFVARFVVSNATTQTRSVRLPLKYASGDGSATLRLTADGFVWKGEHVRMHAVSAAPLTTIDGSLGWSVRLEPGQQESLVLKVPYCVLTDASEHAALQRLDFATELKSVSDYWRRRLDQGAQLATPEPALNEFYRSHAMHLLVNCEREPGSDRRFARVGSFGYGAYGNESCMMVVDLERRGYHREAQDCLDAWLHYQGTVELPGSFAGKEGVLYGAGGYEAGGYNQHHGWILWMLAEHYRFTRDRAWLERSATGITQACDWIIRETARTAGRHELERGLLPAGSLEDIGDWWTWLSTSCYTWRGLDSAAWALEQVRHPEASRIRRAADAYHGALLTNFRRAAERSPVVRLRDGTAVMKFPSHVHRRGRSFGWICETLEGSIHLLITRALDARTPEAAWILKDYEDNLYLSNQYGYTLDDFEQHWFARGGMSMQACLLLDVEPYLYRDDVKHALRAMFNGQAVSYFPDVRMNTEHALPEMGDWRGDHFKSSDESNSTGWLRYLFVREDDNDTLLVGQAIPRDWLKPGKHCGVDRTSTWFGPASVRYTGGDRELTAQLSGPQRNPPKHLRLRFRHPDQKPIASVAVNGKKWNRFQGEWVELPGNVGEASVVARFR